MSRLPLCRTGTPRHRRRCAPRVSPQCRRRPFTHHRAAGGRDCPRASLDLVEQLDDLVFDAIAGNSAALNRLAQLWPQAVSTLEPAVLAEAREQYLRRAVDVWNNTGAAADKTAEQSVAALDVLCLLFPEADFPPDRGANRRSG